MDSLLVTWDGQDLSLTATELGIFRTLLARPGRVFSRDELMDRAYATERVASDRTIDSHVRRLRAKFAAVGAAPSKRCRPLATGSARAPDAPGAAPTAPAAHTPPAQQPGRAGLAGRRALGHAPL